MPHTILLTVDYHDETCVVRRWHGGTGDESVQSVPTTAARLLAVGTLNPTPETAPNEKPRERSSSQDLTDRLDS